VSQSLGSSSDYTDPHTLPKEVSGEVSKVSKVDVSYILHRRVSPLAASKSYETVLTPPDVAELQRSRSFRSEKSVTSMLYARARLVDVVDIVRPKSIEFVTFQNLPPPDAFSSRDDSVVVGEVVVVKEEEELCCYPVVVEASVTSMSSGGQRAETEDDVQDMDLVYQDTLSSTSLEEQLISDDHHLLMEFVNDDDGLPDPLDDIYDDDDDDDDVDVDDDDDDDDDERDQSKLDYVFQTHVLSRISERSCGSTSCQDNTMSDVSSSFKIDANDVHDDVRDALYHHLPPPPLFDADATPVNETLPDGDDLLLQLPLPVPLLLPPAPQQEEEPEEEPEVDDFPSPPSSIDNLPDDIYSGDSSS